MSGETARQDTLAYNMPRQCRRPAPNLCDRVAGVVRHLIQQLASLYSPKYKKKSPLTAYQAVHFQPVWAALADALGLLITIDEVLAETPSPVPKMGSLLIRLVCSLPHPPSAKFHMMNSNQSHVWFELSCLFPGHPAERELCTVRHRLQADDAHRAQQPLSLCDGWGDPKTVRIPDAASGGGPDGRPGVPELPTAAV